VIVDTIFSVVFFAMMLFYSWKLSLMVLGFIALIGFIYLSVTPEFRNRLQHKFEMGAQSNSYLVETITGVQTVKSLAIEGTMQRKWEDYLGTYLKSGFKLNNLSNVAKGLSNLLQRTMTIGILYFGVKQVIGQQLTVGAVDCVPDVFQPVDQSDPAFGKFVERIPADLARRGSSGRYSESSGGTAIRPSHYPPQAGWGRAY
jgi:ABC-type bacteriocin/lantibiotic exporter with double-glycine peptidase domain